MTNKPFDYLFTTTFKIKSEVVDYLKNFQVDIAKNLVEGSLQLDDTSYLTEKMKSLFSDVTYDGLWKPDPKNSGEPIPIKITLLFEHKSYSYKWLSIQLLRYILEIWDRQISQKEDLTIVLPIVVYHGEDKFSYRPIPSLFKNVDEKLMRFIPNFDFLVTDLEQFSEETLLKMQLGFLLSTFLVFKHKRGWDFVIEHADWLFSYEKKEYDNFLIDRFTKAFFAYIWVVNKVEEEAWEDLKQKLPSNLKDKAMNFYDFIVQKGEKRGEKRAKLEKDKIFVTRLLKKFPEWSDEEIASLVLVKVNFVKEIRESLNN